MDIAVFGRQAENCNEYLSKGRLALFEGRLSFRKWETEYGQTKSKLEVVANQVQFMPSGRGEGSSGRSQEGPSGSRPAAQDEGDVPF